MDRVSSSGRLNAGTTPMGTFETSRWIKITGPPGQNMRTVAHAKGRESLCSPNSFIITRSRYKGPPGRIMVLTGLMKAIL